MLIRRGFCLVSGFLSDRVPAGDSESGRARVRQQQTVYDESVSTVYNRFLFGTDDGRSTLRRHPVRQ